MSFNSSVHNNKVAIIGTAGLPPNYGGFETFVSNLVLRSPSHFSVYCSSYRNSKILNHWKNCRLHYVPLPANGMCSILYDIISCIHAILYGYKKILILGVSGALIIPVLRAFSNITIYTNVDGIEWRRQKWSFIASVFLRFSENLAVKFSHHVIADNLAISQYIWSEYSTFSYTIPYGGDNCVIGDSFNNNKYILCVCRIEPENNVHMILNAVAASNHNIIFIGNWSSSLYGINLKARFHNDKSIVCSDPIYDSSKLDYLRSNCLIYIHGHSAGGTNPSLVEMMFYNKLIVSYDCIFNRVTLNNMGLYFKDSNDLINILNSEVIYNKPDRRILHYAKEHYTWSSVTDQYFKILNITA